MFCSTTWSYIRSESGSSMTRAVFLDRDGVINEMVASLEGLDSPRSVDEFKLVPGAAVAIRRMNDLGLPVVVVSNQPGVAKGKFPASNLEAMTALMKDVLGGDRAVVQGIYYCMHHPQSVVDDYRKSCECRKPKPGLLVQAAKEMNLGLIGSYMVGDQPRDMIAGKSVGCTTLLVGVQNLEAKPSEADYVCVDLESAARLIAQLEENWNSYRSATRPATN
jgi:D-glycero-D-manno-heptose 1,7-bisphosphate phosphatase